MINFYLTTGNPAKSAYESVAVLTMAIIQPISKIFNVMSLRKSLPHLPYGFPPKPKRTRIFLLQTFIIVNHPYPSHHHG